MLETHAKGFAEAVWVVPHQTGFAKVSPSAGSPARDKPSLGLANTLSGPVRSGLEYFECRGTETHRESP